MRFFSAYLLLFACLLLAVTGCKEEDKILKATVEHEDREAIRLCVAIMKRGKDVWFFRLSGPDGLVKKNEGDFETFVKSAKFDEKKVPALSVTEPKEWRKDPPGAMRFAGYRIGKGPRELEVTITKLPGEEFDLLQNVHRWQKQVQVPLVDRNELEKFERGKIEDQEVTWVRLDGMGVHTVSRPPDVLALNQKKLLALGDLRKKGAGPAGATPFQHKDPDGWVKQAPNDIEREVYLVGDGNETAKVSVSSARGSVAENINRWRDQVKLPRVQDREAERSAEKITVAGKDGYYVDLPNLTGPPGRNRILGVVIPFGQETWFIKMTGSVELVGNHKKAFETFFKSFQAAGH